MPRPEPARVGRRRAACAVTGARLALLFTVSLASGDDAGLKLRQAEAAVKAMAESGELNKLSDDDVMRRLEEKGLIGGAKSGAVREEIALAVRKLRKGKS